MLPQGIETSEWGGVDRETIEVLSWEASVLVACCVGKGETPVATILLVL